MKICSITATCEKNPVTDITHSPATADGAEPQPKSLLDTGRVLKASEDHAYSFAMVCVLTCTPKSRGHHRHQSLVSFSITTCTQVEKTQKRLQLPQGSKSPRCVPALGSTSAWDGAGLEDNCPVLPGGHLIMFCLERRGKAAPFQRSIRRAIWCQSAGGI